MGLRTLSLHVVWGAPAGGVPSVPSSSASPGGGMAGLAGRMRSYVEAVRNLNDANLARQPFNAVSRFGAAAAVDPDGAHLPAPVAGRPLSPCDASPVAPPAQVSMSERGSRLQPGGCRSRIT